MAANLKPARLVPPGRILARELDARGWTQVDLAAILERPKQTISNIVTGKKQITPDTAIDLGNAFGTSAELWMNLESNYRLRLAEQEQAESATERRRRLFELMPVREAQERGWIRKSDSIDELEMEVCAFLGISQPNDTPRLAVRFRGSEGKNADKPACMAWLKRVEHLAKVQKVGEYSQDRLMLTGIQQVLKCAVTLSDIRKVAGLLANYGVCLLYLRHLPKTYLDGATSVLDSGSRVVALTLRHNRIDTYWFTLMHELAHVIHGHGDAFLDRTNHADTAAEERKANGIASDWLVPKAAFEHFVAGNRPYFSESAIRRFADSIERHPGIVLGKLQWDKHVAYRHLRKLLEDVSPSLGDGISA